MQGGADFPSPSTEILASRVKAGTLDRVKTLSHPKPCRQGTLVLIFHESRNQRKLGPIWMLGLLLDELPPLQCLKPGFSFNIAWWPRALTQSPCD